MENIELVLCIVLIMAMLPLLFSLDKKCNCCCANENYEDEANIRKLTTTSIL